jgi:hypothetical protein
MVNFILVSREKEDLYVIGQVLQLVDQLLYGTATLRQWPSIRKSTNDKRLTRTSHGSAGASFG